jgi:hypothetical protein
MLDCRLGRRLARIDRVCSLDSYFRRGRNLEREAAGERRRLYARFLTPDIETKGKKIEKDDDAVYDEVALFRQAHAARQVHPDAFETVDESRP